MIRFEQYLLNEDFGMSPEEKERRWCYGYFWVVEEQMPINIERMITNNHDIGTKYYPFYYAKFLQIFINLHLTFLSKSWFNAGYEFDC